MCDLHDVRRWPPWAPHSGEPVPSVPPSRLGFGFVSPLSLRRASSPKILASPPGACQPRHRLDRPLNITETELLADYK